VSNKLWGVGQARGGPTVLAYPVTEAEISRDSVWAGRQLARHAISAGRFVLLVSMSNEGAHVHPFDIAARAAGLPLCQVDAVPYEAARVISIMKNLPVGIVLGLTGGIIAALAESGAPVPELFSHTTVLLRPDAADGWGPALHWYPLGPAVAFECPAASGAHVNGTEWAVRASDSGLRVSGLVEERRQFRDVATGLAGRVLTARCECGSEDPRVVLSDL
jgi:hypothetical protein